MAVTKSHIVSLQSRDVVDAIHEISTHYDTGDLDGFRTVDRSWLP